ncbi:thioredoxin family protein [Alicyclobacillus tolerans]|uniref:Thioredoxin-like negative regulator of GroEL n=2 Tax=Alicyclobacillus tolerans TaxID=90970 RepID=A0ABT9LZN1_9BACL|nr:MULTISPECIES: thioredoxin family protein [Alicyclobacillus]MDP9729731.1 thioredoxin-like negative regulator of GroEL [Alicyclobacillus tengchongensis]QRF22843.1 thioredoxin family protein [Alicyclobacillus sp. TC]SHK73326.1 Thiol-disulfide isomerase or thioredoxin [Alicyclobacillus montanus]
MELTTLTQFEEAIASGHVIVEVYANWCPDCRRIEGDMPKWAEEFASQFQLYRINRDEVPEVAERYEVLGIPTFLVFENGELKNRLLSRDAKSAQQVHQFLVAAYA